MPQIPLDQIDAASAPVRRAGAPADDASLRQSIGALGILQPVLLRPHGNRYVLVAGARRLAAARELGLETIPAHIEAIAPQHETAAALAENMVRQPMEPLDQWRAIRSLREHGYTLDHAAAALGLSPHQGKRLDRLSRLHSDILALIERHGLPDDDDIGTIAMAPLDVQARAIKSTDADSVARYGRFPWYKIVGACSSNLRIPRARAIFDVFASNVVFEEDLFAEPGDDEVIFTHDAAGFLAAQQAALEAQVQAARANGKRVQLAKCDKHGRITPPKGWTESYGNPDRPKKTETVLMAVGPGGEILRLAATPPATKTADPEPAAEDQDAPTPAPKSRREAAEPDAPAPEPRDPISTAGHEYLARARTEALRRRVLDIGPEAPTDVLLELLVIALSCWTVRVTARPDMSYGHAVDFTDLREQLMPVGKGEPQHYPDALREVAAEALSRLLVCNGPPHLPDTSTAAIARTIEADKALPRFDTEEFLAFVSGAELKRLAADIGLRPAKTVAGLRAQLAGALPDWRPTTFAMPTTEAAHV